MKTKKANPHQVDAVVNCSDLIISIQSEQGNIVFSTKVAFKNKNHKLSIIRPACYQMVDGIVRKLCEQKIITST
jgi:hypothetical protein